MVVSGGGTGAITSCFRRAGASRNFVEAVVPYSRKAMTEYLGEPAAGPYASLQTAKQLAKRALTRASDLADSGDAQPAGLSLVASLPTQPPRDQIHQIHVAVCAAGPDGSFMNQDWSRQIESGITSRETAEAIADQMLADAIERMLKIAG